MSQIEDLLEFQLRALKIAFRKEVSLVPGRRYRWDFVVQDLAIEVQGGIYLKGRSGHSSGTGIQRDCDKGFEALKAGFRPLSLTSADVKSGEGLRKIQTLIRSK